MPGDHKVTQDSVQKKHRVLAQHLSVASIT